MALAVATVWEARAGSGADANGGGFVAGATGTDYSQQAAAQFSGTDLAVDATLNTKVTSATHNFVAADVGNLLNISAGTGWTTGFYQIVSVAANAATLDRSPAAVSTTAGTWAEGGALATLSKLSGAMVAQNKAYCTGAFTSTATNTFAQTISPASGSVATRIMGYGSTRGDGTHATLTLATNTGLTGIKATGSGFMVEQFDVDCASLGTSTGIDLGGGSGNVARSCKVSNFATKGINFGGVACAAFDCEVTGGTSAANAGIDAQAAAASDPVQIIGCSVHDNTCPGITAITGTTIERCLITNNSGASSDGVRIYYGVRLKNNTIHGNGRHGVSFSNIIFADYARIRDNIITSNGGFGLNNTGTALPADPSYDGNAYWNNTSGARNAVDSTAGIFGANPYTNVRDVTLTASPYVGGTTGSTANFGLNNTAGAGAACRAASLPATWPGNTGTTSYLDMGAVQHQDPAATGGGAVGGPRVVQGYQYIG